MVDLWIQVVQKMTLNRVKFKVAIWVLSSQARVDMHSVLNTHTNIFLHYTYLTKLNIPFVLPVCTPGWRIVIFFFFYFYHEINN